MRNLKWEDGKTNPAGITSRIFYLSKNDIETYPVMKDAPVTVDEESSYEGDYELKVGKFAIEIYSTQGAGKLESESMGEKDCKAFNNKGSFSYPDISAAAAAWAARTVNSNGIFIAAHYIAGGKTRWACLGSRDFDSEVTVKATSGTKPGEKKGLEIEVTAPDAFMLPGYTGIVTLEDGTFNCETNVFTAKP